MDLSKIEKLYSNNIKEFGINSKAVGWNTNQSQNLRFDKLLQVITDTTSPFSINELGCGYGELFKYLNEKEFNIERYNGYDISKPMLDSCKTYNLDNEKITLFNKSKIESKADFTITSGIFNVPFDNDKKSWEKYINDTLENMFEFSHIGIAFNLLTSFVDYEADNLYYGNPTHFFDFCKKKFSKKVNLIHDYDLYEWTIVVLK